MFLFLSFLILKYFASKLNPNKKTCQIESDSKQFKLAADFIKKFVVKTFQSDEQTTVVEDVFDKLLSSAKITEFIDTSHKHRISIERLLYEWNYVPAEDSPKHILKVLNDDCIQEILRRLTNPKDFLNAAETCHRFQVNALQCYPSDFEQFTYEVENRSTNGCTGWSMLSSNFLQIFGHLIRGLDLIDDVSDGTLDMIADYCGKTLINVYIKGNENSTTNFNTLSKFKALEWIMLVSVSIQNIELPQSLYDLNFSDVKIEEDWQFIMNSFPNLKSVFFDKISNLTDDAFNAFIRLNSQLKKLTILRCEKLTLSALQNIKDHLPVLSHLDLDCMQSMTMSQYIEIVKVISQLRRLKHLDMISMACPAKILVDSLVENIPTIEELLILGVPHIEEALTGILELKQLKELCFHANFPNSQTSTDEFVIRLIRGLPALTKIDFHCSEISVLEIKNILDYSDNLTHLNISIGQMDVDLSFYKSILPVIKSHIEVKLTVVYGNIDEDIFKEIGQQSKNHLLIGH